MEASSRVLGEKLRPSVPSRVDERLAKIVSTCWIDDPETRPTFQSLFADLLSFQQNKH